MAGASLTTHFPGVVKEIEAKSFTYVAQEGVMRSLVTPQTGTGYSFVEPYFDPTVIGVAGTIAEGTDITTATHIATTRRTYSALEYYQYTILTDKSLKMSIESVKQFHAEAHGYGHAHNLEVKLCDTFASFTNTVTATSTSGLTWAKIAAARTKLERIPKAAPKPYNLVISPDVSYYFFAGAVGNANYGPVGTLADSIQQKYAVSTVVGGINVFQTSHMTAATTQVCGLFSKAGIGLFIPSDLDYRLEEQRDATLRANELVSTFTFGTRVRVPSYGVKLPCYAVAPS